MVNSNDVEIRSSLRPMT